MSTTFGGNAGLYDIHVKYFDESDGKSTSSLTIDGVEVDRWTWDDDAGEPFANANSLTERVIRNVAIGEDAKIEIAGQGDGGEPLRLDAIELQPVAAASDAATRGADASARSAPLAFEGAVGFGAVTDGGRGGEVVHVTNLKDSGHGSLRWALAELDQPRIVVFDVGGTIELSRRIDVKGDVTVAGQTAPGEGVTITGARLRVVESDVIIRGLKIRPGDGSGEEANNRDAISVGKSGATVERVIIDSNSFTWAMDETAATWGGPSDITYSNNIIAEGLDRTKIEGLNSFGLLVGDDTERLSIVGNLFANNEHRNPQLKSSKEIEFVNNVVSNYGINGFEAGGGNTAHLIGNVFVEGYDTAPNNPIRLQSAASGTAYYLKDNIRLEDASDSGSRSNVTEGRGTAVIKGNEVFQGSGIDAMHSSKVLDHVLDNVGARAASRDATDARIVQDVLDGGGRIIQQSKDVPYKAPPTIRSTLADRDGDGIPDVYELKVGSAKSKADANGDVDGDGYTNIEEYINGLIDGFGAAPIAPPSTSVPAPVPAPAPTPIESAAQTTRIEIETVSDHENMRIQKLGDASGGAMLRVVDWAKESAVNVDFSGKRGLYDLTVHYFDEIDGASQLSVMAGGTKIGSWTWDAQLGGGFSNAGNAATKTFENVAIEAGETIRLVGQADGGEPLRIDALDLHYVGALPVVPLQPGPSEPVPSRPGSVLEIEAEDIGSVSGMRVVGNGAASGGKVLQAEGSGPAAFGFAFDGQAGFYRIAVDHFDEADGESRMAIEVDGARVDAWTWNKALGHDWAVKQTRTTHETDTFKLLDGDTIRFVGEADGGEPLRVDSIRVEHVDNLPAPAPKARHIEAEDIDDLVGMYADSNDAASGGRLIRARDGEHGEAAFDFGGQAGRYDIEIAFFDETDGESRMSLEVDGAIVGSWDWDARLGDKWASERSLTSHRIEDVDLRADSRVALVGEADGGEPLRIDAVTFLPDLDLG